MATVTEKDALQTLIDFYDWHTKLYKNAIDGINDKDAQNRLNTKANHIAWIAGSVMHGRYDIARFLGVDLKPGSYELFKDNKGIQDGVTYPSLDEYRKNWEEISPILRETLLNLPEEKWSSAGPWEMPGQTWNVFDTLVACTDRESYCIGQIGLWRRLLDYPAMKYE